MGWYIKAQNTGQQTCLLSKESRELTIQEESHFSPDFPPSPVQENLSTLSAGSIWVLQMRKGSHISFLGGEEDVKCT